MSLQALLKTGGMLWHTKTGVFLVDLHFKTNPKEDIDPVAP